MPDLHLFDLILFDYGTTNRTDFRNGEIKPIVKTVYTEKSGCLRIRPPPLKYIHTLSDWKNPVSSDLLVKPKDIVRTNPKRNQEKYDEDEVTLDEELIKTRPRLVMTPAVSMDDITDPSARKLLISDVYMSSTTRALKESFNSIKYNNVKAPLPDRAAPSNPIFLPKLQPPLVPPEWRMESVTWDQDQVRSYCNPTEHFWLQRELPKCYKCEETEAVRVHRNMLRDLKRGNR